MAPDAVKLMASPKQITGFAGTMVTVGLATTIAVPFCV